MVSDNHPIQKLTLTVMTHSENCKNQLMDNDLCFALTLGLSTIYIMFQPLALSPGSWVKLRSLPYDERLCNLCQRQDLEDEYHLVLICPVYIELKNNIIKKNYFGRPNMDKFMQLVTTNNKCILKKLAMYLHHAFILRKTLALN